MQDLIDMYNKDLQQDGFALLVSARVNDILSGDAKVVEFTPVGGWHYTPEQEALLFADRIARAVCANMNREDV